MPESKEISRLIERARNLESRPYELARSIATQHIRMIGDGWTRAIKPWNTSRAVTVTAGKPRYTREKHEGAQPAARAKLEQMCRALLSPDDSPPELLRWHPDLARDLYALKPEHREELRREYQEALDGHKPAND